MSLRLASILATLGLTLGLGPLASAASLNLTLDDPQPVFGIGESIDFTVTLDDVSALSLFTIVLELQVDDPTATPLGDFTFVDVQQPGADSYVLRDQSLGLTTTPTDNGGSVLLSLNDFLLTPPSLGGTAFDTTPPNNVVATGSIVLNRPLTATLAVQADTLVLASDYELDLNTFEIIDTTTIVEFDEVRDNLPSPLSITSIPEPGSAALLSLGLASIALVVRRRTSR